ncbi:MAG: sigma-70 family RNA polymerase sigma factor [Bacteroidales bacterium]|nr:sigma-70 family RNA polymerase sigma factor [Bacteroidales bacterium]
MTDLKYIRGFESNDNKVIADFYNMAKPSFVSYFQKNFSVYGSDSDELFQDSYIKMWENIRDGRYKVMSCSLETYLYAIGKYTMLAKGRKYKEIASDSIFTDYDIADGSPDEIEEKEMLAKKADEVVANIGEPCSTILRMHYWDNLSGEQIAEKMDYGSTDSVKTQKYKCMQKVKKLMEKEVTF